MKTQRKTVSILLVAAMILTAGIMMTGCGDDPLETFNKASENMHKADNLSFEGNGKLSLNASGQTLEISTDFKGEYIKSTTDDPADMQIAADISYSMFGQESSIKLYLKDKTAYMDDGTEKTKTKLDKDSLEQLKSLMSEESSAKIDDYVKESSQDGDTLKLKLDTEKYMASMMKKYSSLLDSSEQATAGSLDFKSIEEQIKKAGLEDMDLQATVKDDNFTSMKYALPFKLDGALFGSDKTIEADITFEMSDISLNNDTKEITIPKEKSFK